MEYSNPVASFSFIINIFNVFAWNFLDTFIMMISVTLVFRLKQICSQIKAGVRKKYISLYFWTKVREDYSLISELCQKVNDKIGHMILISFASNMYFVLSQLYKGLTIKRTIIDGIYFIFSFGIVILRLSGVILYGSEVNLQSQKPLRYLISVKSDYYNEEMATAIITYELFMLQTKIN
ncbi:gustatory receptor for sugar taste 64f isoform X2 [Leptinotarsa decemlineata]|uniref:gustatory receptor for sugar taste 64f isoform X2 n=1 Tax=Leptinotarsa decemlineata TaxID=7539 RepID=UPI003D30B05B